MNQIDYFASGTFRDLTNLQMLDLSGNQLAFIREGMFTGLKNLTTLYLSENRITKIQCGSLLGMPNLKHLFLFMNAIPELPASLLWGVPKLKILSMNRNNMTKIHADLFRNSPNLEYLFMQYNGILTIPNNTFLNASHLRYIFMDDNNLTSINPYTFRGARALEILTLSNNVALSNVTDNTFSSVNVPNLRLVYILNTQLVRIQMSQFSGHQKVGVVISPTVTKYPLVAANDTRLQEGLGRNGFTCHGDVCTPCHFGEYQIREVDKYYCKKCPPGGFFQNAVGHFGQVAGLTGCKACARGTYVNVTNTPGKVRFTCKVCPAGTRTDQWSSYRGCYCINNFYRKHRFEECEACPKGGIRGVSCNETQMVKQGYWWKFRDYNESWAYQNFLDTLMEPYDNYDFRYLGFNGEFPKAYPCPRAASCLGLLNSVRRPCETGYGGPLCEICERGYHKFMSRCVKCPTLPWLIVQMSLLGFIFLVIVLILLRDERKEKYKERTLTDVVLARLKIVVGFYQVTSGTLDAFSYIEWPDALMEMSNYAKFLQLNLLQIAPLHCFTDSLKVNAYGGLVLTVGLNVGVVVMCLLYYTIKKTVIRYSKSKSEDQKRDDIHYCKSNCYRSAFLILFITFPETSSRILGLLPPACMRLCQDRTDKNCTDYLKADYTINCFDARYNAYVKFAYAGSVYPILLPVCTFLILYAFYYRKYIKPGVPHPPPNQKPLAVVNGLKFVYENYSPRCWYWEIVEMVRKLALTSGLSLIGSEGRTYIGMAAMASGFYAVAHAQARPIPDNFEHLLQLASLVATFFNLSVGVLLRIPKVMTNYTIENDKDSLGVTVILILANIMVTGLVVVRYAISLGQSFLAVVRNPHCSWECCLSMVLSVQEAGSDFTDMERNAGEQDFKGTLQEGETFEIRGMEGAIGDMGLLDIGLENEGADKDDSSECDTSDGSSGEETLPGQREEPIGEEASDEGDTVNETRTPCGMRTKRAQKVNYDSITPLESVVVIHEMPVSQAMGHRFLASDMTIEGLDLDTDEEADEEGGKRYTGGLAPDDVELRLFASDMTNEGLDLNPNEETDDKSQDTCMDGLALDDVELRLFASDMTNEGLELESDERVTYDERQHNWKDALAPENVELEFLTEPDPGIENLVVNEVEETHF